MTTSKYVVLKDAKYICIKGQDSKEFLQGIITNDIYKCDTQALYSCLLSPQGKFLSDFFIIPFKDYFLIEINKIFFENFINKLNIYKLRSKVEIIETNNLCSIVLINNFSDKKFKEGKILDDKEFIRFIDPRNIKLGQKIIINNNLFKKFINKNNLIEASIEEYEYIMIQNLIPNSLKDLTVNKSLLLENNFDKINSLDWDKGCYVGQEITARMKYRALLKKKLRLIKKNSGFINFGDEIFLDKKIIGKIKSVSGDIGLAMIKIDEANKAKKNSINLSSDNGEIEIIN